TMVLLRNLDAWNAAQKNRVLGYVEDPSPDTDLVMLGKKLGAREKLLAAVKKSGEVHDFAQPTGKALVKWVVGYARKQGLEISEDVAQDLTDRCSGDKVRSAREAEKLALYVENGAATLEDVDKLCLPDLQSNIFAFVDSLGSGDRGRAISLLEDLIGTGEPALRVTYMMRRQFHLLARARALSEAGTPRSEIASQLKVPPFVARKLEDQSRRLDGGTLEDALGIVLDLERGLKGGRDLADELQVEMAVMKLSR
ncbi:MAG TPA: DNA polymerase III subunit delta, partial [Rubrobacteraceae bacterium]|nr:DNA polymerase III subunit delta [Rubrobacteraceae bacterium]